MGDGCSFIVYIVTKKISIANAAALNKRAVTPDVQTCINDLVATDQQLAVVTAGVSSYLFKKKKKKLIGS
jgi:phosphoserine phosphatase